MFQDWIDRIDKGVCDLYVMQRHSGYTGIFDDLHIQGWYRIDTTEKFSIGQVFLHRYLQNVRLFQVMEVAGKSIHAREITETCTASVGYDKHDVIYLNQTVYPVDVKDGVARCLVKQTGAYLFTPLTLLKTS